MLKAALQFCEGGTRPHGAVCFSFANLWEPKSGPRVHSVPCLSRLELTATQVGRNTSKAHSSLAKHPSSTATPTTQLGLGHSEGSLNSQPESLLGNHKYTYISFHVFIFFPYFKSVLHIAYVLKIKQYGKTKNDKAQPRTQHESTASLTGPGHHSCFSLPVDYICTSQNNTPVQQFLDIAFDCVLLYKRIFSSLILVSPTRSLFLPTFNSSINIWITSFCGKQAGSQQEPGPAPGHAPPHQLMALTARREGCCGLP